MALLGKISAVLTASTADFTRKIGGAKDELKSLEKRVSGIQLNLNTRALDGTLTKLQQFKRTLEEVRKAQAAGNGPFIDTRALRDQFRAFEDIGKPLTDLKNKIEGLSTTLQQGLYPELEKIQKGWLGLYSSIRDGSATFDGQSKKIENLRAAIVRLSRAAAAANDLGGLSKKLDADLTGASFFQAAAKEALQKSLQLRAQAESLPARMRSDFFADLAIDAESGAQRIERAAARVLRAQLEIARYGETPSRLGERAAAEDELNSATRRQRAVNVGFERQIADVRIASVIAPEATNAVDSLSDKLESLAGQLRDIDNRRFQGLISGTAAIIRQFNSVSAAASRAKASIDAAAESRSPEEYYRKLDYSDVSGRNVDPSDSAKRYAQELSKRTSQEVDALTSHLRGQFEAAMKSLGMKPSDAGASQSWATWDIGKQLWMNADKSRSGKEYRTADPFTDAQIQREMVSRMVGWEVMRAKGGDAQSMRSFELTKLGQEELSRSGFSPAFSRISSSDGQQARQDAASLKRTADALAKQAAQAISSLEATVSSAKTGDALAGQTRSLLFSDAELRRQKIQSDFDRETARSPKSEFAAEDARIAEIRKQLEAYSSQKVTKQVDVRADDRELKSLNKELESTELRISKIRAIAKAQSIGPARLSNLQKPLSENVDELISRIKSQSQEGDNASELFSKPDWERLLREKLGQSPGAVKKLELTARAGFGGALSEVAGGFLGGRGVGEGRATKELESAFAGSNVGRLVSELGSLELRAEKIKSALSSAATDVDTAVAAKEIASLEGKASEIRQRLAKIPVGFDASQAEQRLAQLNARAGELDADIAFGLNVENAKKELASIRSEAVSLGETLSSFRAGIDPAEARRQLSSLEAEIESKKAKVDVYADVDTREVDALRKELADLERERISKRSAVDRAEIRRDVNLTRESLNNEIIPRNSDLQRRADESGDDSIKQKARELTKTSREINAELNAVTNLEREGDSEQARKRLSGVNDILTRQKKLYEEIAEELNVVNQARRQQDMFLEASGSMGEQLSQGARDAASDVSVARQFRGQIASGASRIAIQSEIDQVTASVTALQQEIAKVANSKLGSNEKVAELDRLDNEIRQSTQNLARLVAQYSGGAFSEKQIADAMRLARNTAGSISTRGAAAAQLAIQQGLFAIDDLISSTGGLEYKLRAVGNNITQLGLLLGQSGLIPGLNATTGLFIGLAAVIGGQAVSALTRWINGGKSAEDQTKALNDSLARQKSLVEELAQAFQTLGDSIARTAFSGPAQQAREFQQQSQKIKDRQKEIREANVVDLDPAVQRERANQNRLKRELESESDIGRRTAIDAQIRASREKERQLAENALRSRPTAADVVSAIEQARSVVEFDRSRRTDADPRQFTPQERERRRREAVAGIDPAAAANDVENLLAQRRALAKQVADLTDDATSRDIAGAAPGPENVRAARQRNRLEGVLASIELPLKEALDDLSSKILESSFGLSLAIGQAQDDVADAIRRGVSGAAEFQAGLDNTARQLDEAQKRLAKAQEISDPDQRTAATRRAEAEVRDLEMRRDAINEQSRELRLTTGRGGERTTAALSSLQGNERFANEYGRLIARLRDAVDRETQARRQLDQAIANNDQQAQAAARAELDAASAASDLAAATAEAAIAMEQSLSRIRKIGGEALSRSERLADDAQKRFTEDPTEQNRRDRDAAEQQLISDRERLARANNAIDRRRAEIQESDPRVKAINAELESIANERKRLSDEAAKNGTQVSAADSERLANREASLLAERESRLRSLMQAELAHQDAIAREIEAREKMIAALEKQRDFDKEIERRSNPQGDPMRGLDLAESPAQRAARETEQGILDIDAAFRERGRQIVDKAGGLFDIDAAEQKLLDENETNRQDALRRFAKDQRRDAAPAIFALADSVANAVLQGPSRAALNVSDISTQEGARELNRLIRGEDPARDQNLIELQKQSQELAQVNTKLTALANRVGVAL